MQVLHLLARGGIGGIESLCVDIAKYSDDINHFYFLWGGGSNAELIKQYTPNVVIRKFKNTSFIHEYRAFKDYIVNNSIDCIVVQGMSPMMLIFVRILKKCKPQVKSVLYLHANAEDLFQRKWVGKLFSIVYNSADGCIAISKSVKDSVKNICKRNIVRVIYNGTDCNKFLYKDKVFEHSKIKMIFVGRLIKKKGLDLLINALSLISEDFELIVVGEGEEKNNLVELSNFLNLSDKIKFVGKQMNINEWILEADLFVHPAVWKEGFGISLIESMACGVPCVAFKNGAIPEIITDNINGYLVDEISIEALAKRIEEVFWQRRNRVNEFMAISKAARERAEEFNVQRYVKELSSYLNNLD